MRDLLAAHRPLDWPLVFAVDASTWPRCDAETSAERGFYYLPSTHSAGQPIVAGWSYQWVSQLDWANDSWTAPMDARRIPPTADTLQVTTAQVRDLLSRLGDTPTTAVFAFDAGYHPIALTHELTGVAAVIVVRIRDDRVFYTDPIPPAPGTRGRPRRHGHRVKLTDPGTWPTPDVHTTSTDDRYGTVHVAAWHRLHPQLGRSGHCSEHDKPPIVRGTLVRVNVEHLPKPTSRTKKTRWLWVAGPDPDLQVCWRAYLRRFDIEHTFRFVKNTLGWTTPSVRTPEQADRLDLARRRRLHPAAARPQPRRGPPPALGTTSQTRPTHPRPRPTRISSTRPHPGHPRQSTEIPNPRPRPPTPHPPTPTNPSPSNQEGRQAGLIAS